MPPRWDSNPQSQQTSDRRPKPQTARPPEPAYYTTDKVKSMNSGHVKHIIKHIHYVYFSKQMLLYRNTGCLEQRLTFTSMSWDLSITFRFYLILILILSHYYCYSTIWNNNQVTNILYSLFVWGRTLPKKYRFLCVCKTN